MGDEAHVRASWRNLIAPGVATLLSLTVLVGLGIWQLRRLEWKNALVATIGERTVAAPMPLPPEQVWPELRPEDYEYRHVSLVGTFDHADETHVFRPLAVEDARGQFSGVGDLVLTPLRLASGAIVIVNRGFVPQDCIDPTTRPQGQVVGTVTITGLMRSPEARNIFTPADDAKTGTWFTRDPAAIAGARNLDRVAPFTVDADAGAIPGGLPQGGETVLAIPNNHLSYALTWFGLGLGLCGVFVAFAWKRLRDTADQPPRPSVAADHQKSI